MLPYALDYSQIEWEQWLERRAPRFVSKQILHWIFAQQTLDPLHFTNIPHSLRKELAVSFYWQLPLIEDRLHSSDGSEKLLLKTKDGLFTEAVIMPSPNRVTLCVSSQVGCRMGCTFCQTGKMGFKRNLSSGEILAQVLLANRRLQEREESRFVSNVVFMGMGEPLDNYDEVVKACALLIDPAYFGLSKHRVTISTSGVVPQIDRLARDLPVRLAISLHSAYNERRSQLMPINRRYSLETLKGALLNYPAPSRYGITFEYVMIRGENDSMQDAKRLVAFLHGLKAKVNLIPMNHFPGSPLASSELENIRQFQKYLSERSIAAPIRFSRGQDVSAACGQLAAKRERELNLSPVQIRRSRKLEISS